MGKFKTIGAVLGAIITAPAFAADLPPRREAPAPYVAPAPIMSWTGFYAGLNAGYTWSQNDNVDLWFYPIGGVAAPGFFGRLSAGWNAAMIGGQVGYNRQLNESLVVGIEADIDAILGGRRNGTLLNSSSFSFVNGDVAVKATLTNIATARKSLDYLATLRGRFGFLMTPQLMLYATGGLAIGGARSNFAVAQIVSTGGSGFGYADASSARIGWTVGAGAEYKLSQRWTAKLEYLYYDLGRMTYAGLMWSAGAPYSVAVATPRFNGHLVRLGVNYQFGSSPAPVVAKY
ncbi:MAG: porin family protein [Hyphomicrobiales bacterium]|nr:porin family protein [Hyphomicrobiales bacterium]